jgi:hypothetical protein
VDIAIGWFQRSQKPIILNNLHIKYNTPTGPIRVILVPTNSAFTFIWNTNKIIRMWYDIICDIRRSQGFHLNDADYHGITVRNYSNPETLEGY